MKKLLGKLIKPIKLTIKELKLVEWISLKQTGQMTLLVLVICIIVGIIIVVFDLSFYKVRDFIIDL